MGLVVRNIGIARARTKIGMPNLAYNLTRYVWQQGELRPLTTKSVKLAATGRIDRPAKR
ncbi:hypothetical protein NKH60_33325 [Mesorhizobium sp. M1006]|uniref:hypothetical protein n=1 Tax=Mesorhizobium sp. M1006 TaxID=2957048 RepID=UPI00333C041D